MKQKWHIPKFIYNPRGRVGDLDLLKFYVWFEDVILGKSDQ